MKQLPWALVMMSYVIWGTLSLTAWWWQWILGWVVAVIVVLLDKVMTAVWLRPYEQLSLQFQFLVKNKQWWQALKLLIDRSHDQGKLLHRSLGFGLVWMGLSVYVITSTASVIAMGLVMGMGSYLAVLLMMDWSQPEKMRAWFGWQVKRELSVSEVKWVAGIFIGWWLLMSGWLFGLLKII